MSVAKQITDDCRHDKHKQAATDTAFPSLSRRYAREKLVTAKERTGTVGSGVVDPEENKQHERNHHVVVHQTVALYIESQNVDHRQGQGDVHLGEHRVGPVVNGILILEIQLTDEEIDHREQIGHEDNKIRHDSASP